MANQVLSLSLRPQSLDDLIGQKHMVRIIRGHVQSGRMPAAWLFSGASGCGKTTTARILALSLQCTHQEVFGVPCADCIKQRHNFDIVEINAAEASGVEETEAVITGAFYNPKPPSTHRVYIFDESQNLSKASQSALLKYFEDSPPTTVWIICTTEPQKILKTLRRRCMTYAIPDLGIKGTTNLVQRAIDSVNGKKPVEPLVEALLEANVSSPGFIMMAVEKYLAGEEPEKAAQVGLDSSIDTLRVCRSVVKGDWEDVRQVLFAASPDDARAVRASVGGYLKAILLNSTGGQKAKLAADGIRELSACSVYEEGLQLSGTIAAMYRLCQWFSSNGR
jgi:hypothetical protein